MDNQTPITVSSLDLARLERLLESDTYRNLPGIDALQSELDRANVVEPADVPPGLVTMNSTVRFIDDESKTKFELTLVYPEEGGGANKVSVIAPAGSALLGLSVGQSIFWQVPEGRKLQLRVLEVLHQPESMGQFQR